MKKFIVLFFAGIILSGSVAYAATSTQEALLAQMIGMLQQIGDSLAALITNTSKSGSTEVNDIAPAIQIVPSSVGSATSVSSPTKTPIAVPASPYRVTNPGNVSDAAWTVGSTYSIEWTTTPTMGAIASTNYVDVYLVSDVSKTPIWKIESGVANTGKMKWTIPATRIYPGTYRIAVQSFANPTTRTYSETFTIVSKESAAITVSSNTSQTKTPTGSELDTYNCTAFAQRYCRTNFGTYCMSQAGNGWNCGPVGIIDGRTGGKTPIGELDTYNCTAFAQRYCRTNFGTYCMSQAGNGWNCGPVGIIDGLIGGGITIGSIIETDSMNCPVDFMQVCLRAGGFCKSRAPLNGWECGGGIGGGGSSNSPTGGSNWSVTSPIAGEVWSIGKTKEIKWTSIGSYKYATIKLVDTKTNKETIISSMAANNGLKLWKVTASAGTYMVKIYPYGFSNKAVMSGEVTIIK